MKPGSSMLVALTALLFACEGGTSEPAASSAATPEPAPAPEAQASAATPTSEAPPTADPAPSEAGDSAGSDDDPATGCLESVATLGEQRCTLDTDCVVVTGGCSTCWGTVNADAKDAVVAKLQARDANKKCAKPKLPPQPKALCKAQACALLDAGEVVGCCSACDDSGCEDCTSVAAGDACAGVRTNCTKLDSSRGVVLACSVPGEDAWGGIGDGEGLGVGGLGLGGDGSAEAGSTVEGLALVHGPASIKGELDEAAVRGVFDSKRAQIDGCYAKAKPGEREGKVSIQFIIAAEGSVGASVVKTSSLSAKALPNCLARAIKGWSFPSAGAGGVVVVDYDFESSASE